jgi:hypothetical protein
MIPTGSEEWDHHRALLPGPGFGTAYLRPCLLIVAYCT